MRVIRTLIVFIIGLVVGAGFVIYFIPDKEEHMTEKDYVGTSLKGVTGIMCTYPQLVNANYKGGVIQHELPDPEVNPFVFIFKKTIDGQGEISWMDSTQEITTAPLMEVFSNDERITYIEGNGGDAFVAVHTIFFNEGVSTYTKSVDLLGIPFATASVGTCKPF